MTIEQQIITTAQQAVKTLYGQEVPEKMVQLQKTKREFEGNLTLVVFLSRFLARNRKTQLRTLANTSSRTATPSPTSTSLRDSSTSSSTARHGLVCSTR